MPEWSDAGGSRSIARMPTDTDVASEFRYRAPPMTPEGLGILVSQSGETADTMAALHYMREQRQHVLAVVNVPESSMARASDAVLETVAGPEMSVASTKAFTAQLRCWPAWPLPPAVHAARSRPTRRPHLWRRCWTCRDTRRLCWTAMTTIKVLAERIVRARDVLYLGRGGCFPIALEGALKLKEISYIHAEGYAAGEMKHGPIALIDRNVPVISIAPSGPLFEKTASNLQEAAARGGQVDRAERCSGRCQDCAASRRRRSCCRRWIRSLRRSCMRSLCSCWPTTWPC